MLPGGDIVGPGLVWFVSSTLVLTTDASLLIGEARHAVVVAIGGKLRVWRARIAALLAQALVVPALLALLGLFPGALVRAPELQQSRAEGRGTRLQSGLSDRFELGGQPGVPLEMLGEEIVVVSPFGRVDEKVPENLYLRSTFFEDAGIDRWTTAKVLPTTIRCESERKRIAEPVSGVPDQTLVILRLDESSGVVLTPPGLFEISGFAQLQADVAQGWYRETNPTKDLEYLVRFQDLTALADRHNPATNQLRRLTTLPEQLKTPAMRGLWRELGGDATRLPAAVLARRMIDALQSRYSYALAEPSGKPGASSLERFLFESRKGYCMHFATALAVFLRMSKIPCRIAVGLQGGRIDPDDKSSRRFGQKHAHAWVEIPFSGLGWVVFDPTPAATLPNSQMAASTSPHPGQSDQAQAGDLGAVLDRLLASPNAQRTLIVLCVVVVLAIAALGGRRLRSAVRAAVSSRSSTSRARQLLHALLREMGERGYGRLQGQTLDAWLTTLIDRPGLDSTRIRAAVDAYQEVRFGGRDLDATRVEALEKAVDDGAVSA